MADGCKCRWLAAALAVLPVSCVHQTVVKTNSAVPMTIWERQINNARDAGDGDFELRALRKKVADEPENALARVELAKGYASRGYTDVALEICRLAAERFPDSGEARLALVRTLRDSNRREEAAGGLDAFLRQHPQNKPEYYSWLGILRDEMGHWPEGEPAHRKALELDPAGDALHNNLGYNLLMQHKSADAAGEFREALKLNPHSQVAHNNLGLVLAEQNAEEAVANWQSAADPAIAHNNLAAVWIEKGNYAAARTELQLALGYNKNLPAALKNLELVSRLDGKPAEMPVKHEDRSGWERWKAGLKKLFVGPLDEPAKVATKTATGATNGEER